MDTQLEVVLLLALVGRQIPQVQHNTIRNNRTAYKRLGIDKLVMMLPTHTLDISLLLYRLCTRNSQDLLQLL
jgi:hypothetical protein